MEPKNQEVSVWFWLQLLGALLVGGLVLVTLVNFIRLSFVL
jgi:hypothetical protein